MAGSDQRRSYWQPPVAGEYVVWRSASTVATPSLQDMPTPSSARGPLGLTGWPNLPFDRSSMNLSRLMCVVRDTPGPLGFNDRGDPGLVLALARPVEREGQPKIAWGAKVSNAFKKKVIEIAKDLQTEADYLMAAMAFETGETFSASVKNAAGSGAIGLIQFMPATAKALGTTADKLKDMSAESQLEYVAKYFAGKKGKLKVLSDVYMAILWPAAIGKPEDHVLFSKDDESNPKVYQQNAGLDADKDGQVTKKEAAAPVQKKLEKGRQPKNLG